MRRQAKQIPPTAGKTGEQLAQTFLERAGYLLIDVNIRFGKTAGVSGELDIVAWDGPTLCFIEVKTRQDRHDGPEMTPAAAVTPTKQRQLTRLATLYALRNGLLGEEGIAFRFDVVSVRLTPGTPSAAWEESVELIKGAFSAVEPSDRE